MNNDGLVFLLPVLFGAILALSHGAVHAFRYVVLEPRYVEETMHMCRAFDGLHAPVRVRKQCDRESWHFGRSDPHWKYNHEPVELFRLKFHASRGRIVRPEPRPGNMERDQ